ncbi:MAG: hypothetical protein J6A62_07330 [Oscillospiraceae bacterium]|nr:hypothetical protein [Oscillospiraceae bacterium]
MKKKAMALVLALGLVTVGIVGGTMAWLTAEATEVKNVFTDSDINITLTESDTNPNEEGVQHDYKMIPGWTIAKDPKVTVDKNSEDCFVFVKIDKSFNYDDYLENYAVDSAWTALVDSDTKDNVGVDGVYYQMVKGLTADWNDYVLAGEGTGENANGYVTVKDEVTKKMMDELKAETYPTLTFTAYATQLKKNNTTEFSAYEAWVNVYNNSANPTTGGNTETPTT